MDHGPETTPDLTHVRGQETAKRALEIAAAGRHHLLLVGSMGTGKSRLARCLPGLLPPPTDTEGDAIRETYEQAGEEPPSGPPVRLPDITLRATDLLGIDGRPGEAELARGGVLILDDLPVFRPRTLRTVECLLDRAHDPGEGPLLVATMRSCPSGHRGDRLRECTCPPGEQRRYWSRLEGLVERIELHIELPPVTLGELCARPAEDSETVARRVAQVRQLQQDREADGLLSVPESLSGWAGLPASEI